AGPAGRVRPRIRSEDPCRDHFSASAWHLGRCADSCKNPYRGAKEGDIRTLPVPTFNAVAKGRPGFRKCLLTVRDRYGHRGVQRSASAPDDDAGATEFLYVSWLYNADGTPAGRRCVKIRGSVGEGGAAFPKGPSNRSRFSSICRPIGLSDAV